MKLNIKHTGLLLTQLLLVLLLFLMTAIKASAQMPPPGYERAKKMQEERLKVSVLDRDSITLIDTVEIFNPSTYESTYSIISSRYSLRDYCLRFLGIGSADILLDEKPHIIVDPKTYNEITIRLNPAGKIDTIK